MSAGSSSKKYDEKDHFIDEDQSKMGFFQKLEQAKRQNEFMNMKIFSGNLGKEVKTNEVVNVEEDQASKSIVVNQEDQQQERNEPQEEHSQPEDQATNKPIRQVKIDTDSEDNLEEMFETDEKDKDKTKSDGNEKPVQGNAENEHENQKNLPPTLVSDTPKDGEEAAKDEKLLNASDNDASQTKEEKSLTTKHPSGEYRISRIVGERINEGKKEYEIKWIGYKKTSWEPAENFQHFSILIANFEASRNEDNQKSNKDKSHDQKSQKRKLAPETPTNLDESRSSTGNYSLRRSSKRIKSEKDLASSVPITPVLAHSKTKGKQSIRLSDQSMDISHVPETPNNTVIGNRMSTAITAATSNTSAPNTAPKTAETKLMVETEFGFLRGLVPMEILQCRTNTSGNPEMLIKYDGHHPNEWVPGTLVNQHMPLLFTNFWQTFHSKLQQTAARFSEISKEFSSMTDTMSHIYGITSKK